VSDPENVAQPLLITPHNIPKRTSIKNPFENTTQGLSAGSLLARVHGNMIVLVELRHHWSDNTRL